MEHARLAGPWSPGAMTQEMLWEVQGPRCRSPSSRLVGWKGPTFCRMASGGLMLLGALEQWSLSAG